MKEVARLALCLAACVLACGSPGGAAVPDASLPPDADGDAPPSDGDGGALSEFLGACTMNRDCVSEQCLVNPGVCTKTCGDRYDCPLASSWSCAELAAPTQLRICMCPGLTASPGCDLDCNGVDEDGTGAWRHAVMSSLRIVQTAAETAQYGFDLDGNGLRDNKFGLVVVPDFAAIITGSTVPSPVVAELHQADVASGVLLGLVSFHGDDLQTDGCASARVYQARPATPDFSGGGMFEIDPSVPPGTTMYGSVSVGMFRASLGELPVRLRLGRAPNAKVLLHLRRVEFECALGSAGCTSGRLGGGIDESDAPSITIALTAEINYVLATDPQGTEAQQLRAAFDANHDNIITVTEVGAVFGDYSPDMDLVDAAGHPGHDGRRDSISIALAFTSSGAVYAAPGE